MNNSSKKAGREERRVIVWWPGRFKGCWEGAKRSESELVETVPDPREVRGCGQGHREMDLM